MVSDYLQYTRLRDRRPPQARLYRLYGLHQLPAMAPGLPAAATSAGSCLSPHARRGAAWFTLLSKRASTHSVAAPQPSSAARRASTQRPLQHLQQQQQPQQKGGALYAAACSHGSPAAEQLL